MVEKKPSTKKQLWDLYEKFVDDVDSILQDHGEVDYKATKTARHYMDTGFGMMQFSARDRNDGEE